MAKKQPRRIEYMDLDDVQVAKRNPKRHDIDAIKESYKRFSAQDSPVLDERTKRLLSGHGRIEALVALRDAGERPPGGIEVKAGKWLVPVQRGGRTKNDKEAEAYLVAANRILEVGGWDDQVLAEVLDDINNFEGIGFEPDEPDADSSDDAIPRTKRKEFTNGQRKKVGIHSIVCGDCVSVLKTMEDESVDAIVTDPPYGIGYMGDDWDQSGPGEDWARECLRVLKPGGFIVAFAATRTIHRLAITIENSGFEIRDTILWLYWQGFPKNRDIAKAIDTEVGATKRVVGKRTGVNMHKKNIAASAAAQGNAKSETHQFDIIEPTSDDAIKWIGWGTALKPAQEPAVLAQKPFEKPGKGAGKLNIKACTIGVDDAAWPWSADTQASTPPANIYACQKPPANEKNAGVGDDDDATKNHHPTVKPVQLMKWLIRLVTPPGGGRRRHFPRERDDDGRSRERGNIVHRNRNGWRVCCTLGGEGSTCNSLGQFA